MPEYHYADGLSVDWTDKQAMKIEEIKKRLNRNPLRSTSPNIRRGVNKVEYLRMKQLRDEAIFLLFDSGLTRKEIAEDMNMNINTVKHIIQARGNVKDYS